MFVPKIQVYALETAQIPVGLGRLWDSIWGNLPEESSIQALKKAQSPLLTELQQRREAIRDAIRLSHSNRNELDCPIQEEVSHFRLYNIQDIAHFDIHDLSRIHDEIEKKSTLRSLWAIFKKSNLQDRQPYTDLLELEKNNSKISLPEFTTQLFLIRKRNIPLRWEHMEKEFYSVDPLHLVQMRELLCLADASHISIPIDAMQEYVAKSIYEDGVFHAAKHLMIHEELREENFQVLAREALLATVEPTHTQPGILASLFEYMEKRNKRFQSKDVETALAASFDFLERPPNRDKEELIVKMLLQYATKHQLPLSQESLDLCFKNAAYMKMGGLVKDCYMSARALGKTISGETVAHGQLLASLENGTDTQEDLRNLIQRFNIEIPIYRMTGILPIEKR